MPATQSKLKNGTLTLGGVGGLSAHTQASNVRITTKEGNAGDSLELLSGEVLSGDATVEYALAIKVVQDFDDPDGVINWSWDHAGESVAFSWQPNPDAPTYAGVARVVPIEVGGDVAKRLDVDAEWALAGKPVRTFPGP